MDLIQVLEEKGRNQGSKAIKAGGWLRSCLPHYRVGTRLPGNGSQEIKELIGLIGS